MISINCTCIQIYFNSNIFSGHYLYLEASKNTNKTAILVSPTYAGGTYCFSAWYNMYGHEMGYLYFKTIKRGHIHTLRSIHGNHRDKWIYFQAQIKMQNSTPFQVSIFSRN